jgi:hypothetical protein
MPGNGSLFGALALAVLLTLAEFDRDDLRRAASASVTKIVKNARATLAASTLRKDLLSGQTCWTSFKTIDSVK